MLTVGVHVERGRAARLDRVVEGHSVLAASGHRELRGRDCLDGTERVALDAGDLHEAAEGVARESEAVCQLRITKP